MNPLGEMLHKLTVTWQDIASAINNVAFAPSYSSFQLSATCPMSEKFGILAWSDAYDKSEKFAAT